MCWEFYRLADWFQLTTNKRAFNLNFKLCSYINEHALVMLCQFAADERHICQMQYMSWPDHGVPDDCTEFLQFVSEVRQYRSGVVESTIVHCRSVIQLYTCWLCAQ